MCVLASKIHVYFRSLPILFDLFQILFQINNHDDLAFFFSKKMLVYSQNWLVYLDTYAAISRRVEPTHAAMPRDGSDLSELAKGGHPKQTETSAAHFYNGTGLYIYI